MTEPSLGPAAAPRSRSELSRRIVTAAVLFAVAVPCTIFGGMAFTALIAVVALVAAAEWGALCVGARPRREGQILGVATVLFAILLLWGARRLEVLDSLAVQNPVLYWAVLLAIVGCPAWMVAAARRFAHRTTVVMGVYAVGLASLSLIFLRQMSLEYALLVLCVIWVTDIGAFFVGRRFGGPKLAPRISPKKTWSGAIGGTAAALLLSLGVGLWHAATGARYPGFTVCACDGQPGALGAIVVAVLGVALSICGQMGDLLESWLKRRAGVKDSGRLLPGHGGVLDRIDGLLLSAPLAAFALAELILAFARPFPCDC